MQCNIKCCPKTTMSCCKRFCGVTPSVARVDPMNKPSLPKTSLACPNPKTSQPGPQGKLGNQTPICQVLNFPRHHGDPNVSLTSCKLNSHKRPCHQPFATKLDFVVPRTCQQLVSWVCCCASPKKTPNFLVKVYSMILLQ
jgi:hypothetical protein